MSEAEKEKWTIPPKHRLDSADKLAASEKWQHELSKKANNPFVQLSPLEAERARAIRVEKEIRQALEITDDPQAVRALHFKLSEALAIQGRYNEALQYEVRPNYISEYQGLIEALNVKGKQCDCVHHQFQLNKDSPFYGNKGTRAHVTQQFVKQEIIIDGETVQIKKCNSCGSQYQDA